MKTHKLATVLRKLPCMEMLGRATTGPFDDFYAKGGAQIFLIAWESPHYMEHALGDRRQLYEHYLLAARTLTFKRSTLAAHPYIGHVAGTELLEL